MPYLLNQNKHANLPHPDIGILPPLTAIEITEKQAITLKDLAGAIVFNDIIKAKDKLETKEIPKRYEDFVIECGGDMRKASQRWKEYKEKLQTNK